MGLMVTLSIFLIFGLLSSFTNAANFVVVNQCSYTVWAAATPGGGRRMDPGQPPWSFNVRAGTTGGRVWGRTNCHFDPSGHGTCATGGCQGVRECTVYGSPPNTLAEYALNQYLGRDSIDISLVDGFNIPMDFSPTTGGCSGIRCAGTRILDECPPELKAQSGGCNNPCTVYKTDFYCCTKKPKSDCGPTDLSRFFKERCPDAFSYPNDNQASKFNCPGGTNYKVTFCP